MRDGPSSHAEGTSPGHAAADEQHHSSGHVAQAAPAGLAPSQDPLPPDAEGSPPDRSGPHAAAFPAKPPSTPQIAVDGAAGSAQRSAGARSSAPPAPASSAIAASQGHTGSLAGQQVAAAPAGGEGVGAADGGGGDGPGDDDDDGDEDDDEEELDLDALRDASDEVLAMLPPELQAAVQESRLASAAGGDGGAGAGMHEDDEDDEDPIAHVADPGPPQVPRFVAAAAQGSVPRAAAQEMLLGGSPAGACACL